MATIRMIFLLAIVGVLLLTSCAAPASPTIAPTQSSTTSSSASSSQPPVPTQPPAATVASTQPVATTRPTTSTAVPTKPAASSSQTSTGQTKLNMDEIFPPGPGREAMLDNCTTCHTFVPMVVLQMPQAQWDRNARDHRDKVPRMSEQDFKATYEYLAKNFNPDRPVPKLPKELLDTWTDY